MRATPSWLSSQSFANFYFEGDCNDPNVQDKIKQDFWSLISGLYLPPPFCQFNPNCKQSNIKIFCGKTSAADKRRRRANTREVNVRFDYVNKETNLPQHADDKSSQDAYTSKKQDVQVSVINDVASKTSNQKMWNEFKVSSGLELKDSFKIKDVDAYCSEDGAVVRKCDAGDVNWSTGEYICNKESGSITKCSKCLRI